MKVIGIDGKPAKEPDFDTGVTTIIEDIYAKARSGKVTGIAVCLMIEDGEGPGFSVTCTYHGPRMSLLGSVGRLAHKLNKDMDELSS